MCGTLFNRGEEKVLEIECETHPDCRAIGFCVICGKPVCSDCEVRISGKILCTDPEHRILLQEWCVIHQPNSVFEAEALVHNLEDGGIEAKTFSLHDHVTTHWLNENRVLIFVKILELEKALARLRELNLVDKD